MRSELGRPVRRAKPIVYYVAEAMTLRRGVRRFVNGEVMRLPVRWARYYPSNYQRSTFDFVQAHCRRGTTGIDVGAHLGIFSVAMARVVGPAGRVVSFEPTPDTRRALRDVIRANRLSDVVEIRGDAVTGKVGRASFHALAVDASVANSLIRDPRSESTIDVRTVSIDATVKPSEEVSCMKIDAEGAEIDVLAGALDTIRRCLPAIALDVHPGALGRGNASLGELWAMVQRIGYRVMQGDQPLTERAFLANAEGGPFDVQLVHE